MTRYRLQTSTDGEVWSDSGRGFTSRAEARAYFEALEGPSMDWRVGFLLRTREGAWYRAVDKTGREVRSV